MLYEEILNNVIDLLPSIENKKVYIFGTGKGGKIVASVLNSLNIRDYLFVDNNRNLWGTKLLGTEVFEPSKLLLESKENIIVLVASSYFNEIANQLVGYSFKREVNFFSMLKIKEKEKENKISVDAFSFFERTVRLCNHESLPDVMIFGDSVMTTISYEDKDTTNLYEMINEKVLTPYVTDGIYYPGFHIGVFYCILHTFNYFEKFPSVIVLPINMRNFSPEWDCNPDFEYSSLVNQFNLYLDAVNYDLGPLFKTDKGTPYDSFLSYTTEYGNNLVEQNSKFVAWVNREVKNNEEFYERYKFIYMWHYMFKLTNENRKLQLLQKMIRLFKCTNVKIITYITPINYKSAEKYGGSAVLKAYERNVALVKECFNAEKASNIFFDDYSFIFTPENFAHKNETTEHLNESGRIVLSQIIGDKINDILKHKKE